MSDQKTVAVELCLTKSIGSRYCEPEVKEWREVTEEEAGRLCREQLPNGYYWRRQDALGQWDHVTPR